MLEKRVQPCAISPHVIMTVTVDKTQLPKRQNKPIPYLSASAARTNG